MAPVGAPPGIRDRIPLQRTATILQCLELGDLHLHNTKAMLKEDR